MRFAVSQSQPCGDAKRAATKLSEKMNLRLDYDTVKRLSEHAERLGARETTLIRAFIARGLQQAEAARDS
jgi:predicted DNA-binding protein